MALCTIDQVKAQYDADPGDGVNAQIEAAISLVSGWFPMLAGRYDHDTGQSLLERFEDRAERHTGGETFIRLAGRPVLAIAEIVEATRPGDWDTATPLVADEDYHVRRDFVHRIGGWTGARLVWSRFVRVTYSGGFDPAGTPAPTLPLPPVLTEAAATQARHMAEHWQHFGQAEFQVGTGSISRVKDALLDSVREVLGTMLRGPMG